MSRLEAHKKKVFLFRLVFFIGVLLAVIFFIFSYGFKLLIQSSLIVNQLAHPNSKQATSAAQPDVYGSFSVDNLPMATSSAKIIVSGSVQAYDKIEFFLNDQKIKTITVNADFFQEEIGDLRKGDNKIYALAKNTSDKQQKKSTVFTVSLKNDKPKLEVTEPLDHAITNKQEIKVAGRTDKEVFVKINGLPIVVDSLGNFQTIIKLSPGDNKIEIIAIDDVDNSENKTLTVTYRKDD